MKKKLLSFALALSMLLGVGAVLPENAFTESTSISASADESWKCIATGEHQWSIEKHVIATCDRDGYRLYKCKRCGKTKKDVDPRITEHDFFDWEVRLEPTCTQWGMKTRKCRYCDFVANEAIKPTGHKYDKDHVEIVDATCTVGKYRRYICTACGEKKIEYLSDPLGHDWGEWTTANPATCEQGGVEVQTCSRCKATNRRNTNATGHNWSGWTTEKEATCEQDGLSVRTCANCSKREEQTIAKTGHNMGDWTVTKPQTCNQTGEKERRCRNAGCNHTEKQELPKTDLHSWSEWKTTKAASCKADGVRERSCTCCGKTEKETIAKGAHNYTWKTTKAATCSAEGEKVGTCIGCGAKKTEKTAKTGHEWKDPEWTWSKDYKTCTAKFVCKHNSSHIKSITAKSEKDEEPATCKAKGSIGYVAQVTVDGKRYSIYKQTEQTPKLSHSFGSWKVTGFDTKKGTSFVTAFCTKCKSTEEKAGGEAVYRLAGKGRYETAAAISKQGFKKADTVVLAYSMNYADALAGVSLAHKLNAPILLTDKGRLDAATAAEIKRLGAKKAVILGGEGAISKDVEKQVKAMGLSTERLAGSSRFGTATKIAQKLTDKPTTVFFVYGMNYADALSVSTAAAVKNAPVIYLKTKGDIDADTAAYLKSIKGSVKNAYVIGGTGVISDSMKAKAEKLLGVTAKRVSGANRYETCVAVNTEFRTALFGKTVCLATGHDFPDALAGGVFAAQKKAPLMLVNGKSATALSDSQKEFFKTKSPVTLYVFGGTGAVCDRTIKW